VLVLTAGVDVQRDRLEIVILGHGKTEFFVIAQHVIWGSPHEDHTWAELDHFLRGQWRHPNGGTLRLDAVAIDAGDGETMDSVIAFCRPRFPRRVVAIKGAPGARPAIKASETKGSRLFILGVDGLKATLASHLSRGRTVRFSDSLEDRFFDELASERRLIRYQRGAPVRIWERITGRRAESLDCMVYALAVRTLVGFDLGRREAELSTAAAPSKPPVTIRSAWLGN